MKPLMILAALLATAVPSPAQSPRLASDFEIAEMKKEIAKSSDFLSQLSARLNLGDLYLNRNDIATARAEYESALAVAQAERLQTRRNSDMTGYATATAYAGLAQAKLRRESEAFDLLEEAIRYTSDSAKTWNLYATAMSVLQRPHKAVPAARNAVSIAAGESNRLDLAIYRHALASALIGTGETEEAEQLLRTIVTSLHDPAFDSLRREIARSESFEIYSTARGEAAAYLSLLNRAQLRLAHLLESRGEKREALEIYRRVLDQRSDDATALAALARLSTRDEQARWFDAAFDANPFSISLVRAYQRFLEQSERKERAARRDGTGAMMQRAIEQRHGGQTRAARESFESLLAHHPGNATLRRMIDELDTSSGVPHFLTSAPASAVEPNRDELRQLIAAVAADRLDPEHRAALDAIVLRGIASFDSSPFQQAGQTVFESGTIAGVPFRFTNPTAFAGSFPAHTPLRLIYRFLGVTVIDGADAILAEPIGIEVIR